MWQNLKKRGIYSKEACRLMCVLASKGVPQERVGFVASECTNTFGVTLKGRPSRWTVGRAITEGEVAANMQIAYELQNAKCKSDGTTNRNVHFTSIHVTGEFSAHGKDRPQTKMQQLTFGIHSTPTHTSEEQLILMKNVIGTFFDTMSHAPPIEGYNSALGVGDATRHLSGMNSDHAED
ncbi:uncharacterized protein EI90DRAFT_2936801, partial [Cantharellus anzutake]|uniref:uncharacterized protein n=1 Tax=Cantharellus anzutake TaxID=1750568 RepID=UPI00190864EF